MNAPINLNLGTDGQYTLSPYTNNGTSLEDAEQIRINHRDLGIFALTRHYDGKFYVYTRNPEGRRENRSFREVG